MSKLLILRNRPSPKMADGQVLDPDSKGGTFEYDGALRESDSYADELRKRRHLMAVLTLQLNLDFPDNTFFQDIILGVLGPDGRVTVIIARSGSRKREGEADAVYRWLKERFPMFRVIRIEDIEPDARIDFGDLVQLTPTLFAYNNPCPSCGWTLARRTNEPAIKALKQVLTPLGHRLIPVNVPNPSVLHLSTASSLQWLGQHPNFPGFPNGVVLGNPDWVRLADYEAAGFGTVPAEGAGGNMFGVLDNTEPLFASSECAATNAESARRVGRPIVTIPNRHHWEVDGSMTCTNAVIPVGSMCPHALIEDIGRRCSA